MSLTNEDKAWITEQLRKVESVDKAWITEQLRKVETVDKAWITEQLRTVETALLTEFHKWASPTEARQRTHAAALRAIDLEMESLSDRVTKVESKQSPS